MGQLNLDDVIREFLESDEKRKSFLEVISSESDVDSSESQQLDKNTQIVDWLIELRDLREVNSNSDVLSVRKVSSDDRLYADGVVLSVLENLWDKDDSEGDGHKELLDILQWLFCLRAGIFSDEYAVSTDSCVKILESVMKS